LHYQGNKQQHFVKI